MKFLPLVFFLGVVLITVSAPLPAQTTDDAESAPPPGATVITSDELHSDQQNHISVFTGKVVVIGDQFRMTCKEMTVYFTKDNKVDKLVATGDVVITQPNRVTHCGHAEYFRDIDTFVLTDQPVILDGKNEIHGTRITIERTTQKMTVDQGRTTILIRDENLGPSSTSQPSTDTK